MKYKHVGGLTMIAMMLLPACSSMLPMSDRQRCDSLIDTAWKELTDARLSSLSEGWRLTKASKFLAQAKVKQETERYEACVEKANIARDLIAGKSD